MIERRPRRLGVEPVDRAADSDNVERAELPRQVLEPPLDERHCDAGALGRRARPASTMPGSGSTPTASRQ